MELYISEGITLRNCQCNVFSTKYSYYNSCFIKNDCSYRNNCVIGLHDAELEHSMKKKLDVHMFFFLFLCSGISDLALRILKMLVRVCFRDILHPAIYQFVPGIIPLSVSLYSKCTVCTIDICHLQVFAV